MGPSRLVKVILDVALVNHFLILNFMSCNMVQAPAVAQRIQGNFLVLQRPLFRQVSLSVSRRPGRGKEGRGNRIMPESGDHPRNCQVCVLFNPCHVFYSIIVMLFFTKTIFMAFLGHSGTKLLAYFFHTPQT